jgi:hypothetical protein
VVTAEAPVPLVAVASGATIVAPPLVDEAGPTDPVVTVVDAAVLEAAVVDPAVPTAPAPESVGVVTPLAVIDGALSAVPAVAVVLEATTGEGSFAPPGDAPGLDDMRRPEHALGKSQASGGDSDRNQKQGS